MNKQEQIDYVRPGEQWFFYWKTSAALWESKIVQFPAHETIFIPLNWGFHAESASSWDFGRVHPERDLHRLATLMTQHGRRFCWILPVTPAPFLPNGGLPVSVARTLSVTVDGVHPAVLDHEGKVNKIFSYFDPKVFQVWGSFLKNFGNFLAQNQIKAKVWGAEFYYFQEAQSFSYLTDYSVAFEQGFSRYLKQNQPQGVDLQKPEEEEKLKTTFTKEVGELFLSTAASALAPFWENVQSIIMLGGSPHDLIERASLNGKSQLNYFEDLFRHYLNDQWVSSVLLTAEEKKNLLTQALDDHFNGAEIDYRYRYKVHKTELDAEFRPLGLINIFCEKDDPSFEKNGLVSHLDENFKWLYRIQDSVDFSTEWIEANYSKLKFFHGTFMDRTRFSQMLKLFMMGQRIVLDTTGLHPDLDKRLQVFFLENNLKQQTVNFQTDVQISELGEGRFITIDGEKLKNNPDKAKLWTQLFRYFGLNQPKIFLDGDVFSLWKIRATSPHELNYLDVRRVNLYNPTSYKKQVRIQTQKHFAFLRSIDPTKAQAKSTPDGVEIELLPNGKIGLDFGHYEER